MSDCDFRSARDFSFNILSDLLEPGKPFKRADDQESQAHMLSFSIFQGFGVGRTYTVRLPGPQVPEVV